MHILEIPSFFPPYGGLFCLDQAKALQALGHEVRILSNVQMGVSVGMKDYLRLPSGRYEHEMDGVKVYQSFQRGLPKAVRFNMRRWVKIVRSMFAEYVGKYGKPDILHAHCAKWAGYAAMLIGQEYGIPYVVTEHLPLMLLEEEFGHHASHIWQISLLKEVYKHADRVLPVSEELVEDISCYYGKDYQWQYVSNTIDTNFFCYHKRMPLSGRPFRFCCVADYYYRKGYDVLFDAYSQLQEHGYKVELHIAGLFTDGRKCQGDIREAGLNGVKAYGRINKTDIRDLLYRCDALVLASRSEVQPLVLLEAMSTGIPVISTECTPQSERVDGACFIVPVGDAGALSVEMQQVMGMTNFDGRAVSEKIRQIASPEVIGKQLEEIFQKIILSRSF